MSNNYKQRISHCLGKESLSLAIFMVLKEEYLDSIPTDKKEKMDKEIREYMGKTSKSDCTDLFDVIPYFFKKN